MRDARLDKWADVLVNYSLSVKPGDQVLLYLYKADMMVFPLMEACYEKLIQAKAHVDCLVEPNSWQEIYFKHANDQQFGHFSPLLMHVADHFDALLAIGGSMNTKLLSNVDPLKQAKVSQAFHPFMNTVMTRLANNQMKWTYSYFPTPASAQDSSMGNIEYEDFVFEACFLNKNDTLSSWKSLEKEQQNLIDFLKDKKELRFKHDNGTDVTVNINGMSWVNCCGHINFPDGEIYTGPNLNSIDGGVNGVVRFSLPAVRQNVEVDGIELQFEKGAVVNAKASKNEDFLRAMITLDEGSKFVGEVGIGTNYSIAKYTKNILFDEKIGGTFHLALGQGYPQTGNVNKSGLHWDLVCDLRDGNGQIFADGQLILENGQFIRKEWPNRSHHSTRYNPQQSLETLLTH